MPGTPEDTLRTFRAPSAQRRRSHGEVQGLDFASEESKGKPESIGQAYRASRRLRRIESGGSDVESEATKSKPESSRRSVVSLMPMPMSTGAGLKNPPAPPTGALQRRRSHGEEAQGLDFPSEVSKDKPESCRRLHRRPVGSKGSDVASEATKDQSDSSRRLRAEDSLHREAATDASPVHGHGALPNRHTATAIRHTATYTGAPDLARERASAHSAAVTAAHAAARRERADAAARRESADVADSVARCFRSALPPRDVEWV